MPNIITVLFSRLYARMRGPSLIHADEDAERKRVLLYAALSISLALSTVCFLLTVVGTLRLGDAYTGVPWWSMGLVLAIFMGLLTLTRYGYLRAASIGIFIAYLTPSLYASARWGIDLPQVLLLDAFLIVMTSVLFGTKPAFFLSAGLSLTLFIFSWLDTAGILFANRYWHDEAFDVWDGVAITATLLCVAFLCSLANYEIERALHRARESEKLLRAERDLLEIRVEERTRELRQAQLEKLTQLSRFAEFGRLAAGFFHDLASPLNALMLNLELMQTSDAQKSEDTFKYLRRALTATNRLSSFLQDVRGHVKGEVTKVEFSATETLRSVIATVEHRAQAADVRVRYEGPEELRLFGNAVGFYKLLTNLIGNAIESYQNVPLGPEDRSVLVQLYQQTNGALLTVEDHGCGMSKAVLEQIWEPFYTTKADDRGIGLGLSIVKGIVEQDFSGTIECQSTEGRGTSFIVHLPCHGENAS